MPDDIGLIGNQYGTAVTLLYATYVPFEGPVAVMLKIIGPKYLLTGCCFAWYVAELNRAMLLRLIANQGCDMFSHWLHYKLAGTIRMSAAHRVLRVSIFWNYAFRNIYLKPGL